MEQNNLCNIILEKYYDTIYKYCYVVLQYNEQAAEDCTQEVFYRFSKRNGQLHMNGDIRFWLYMTADRVLKMYQKNECA